MKKLKKRLLPFVLPSIVFLTGACVLVVEVVATRILSPYYGNTIYAFSSVISVILAALSIGYYFGGRLADRYPSLFPFFGLITLSGLTLLVLQVVSVYALPEMGERLSISLGPLLSSLAFFFVPAILMGTLSPYAVKLQKSFSPQEGVGTAAGSIFFWSTLGSIFGSLLAGFVLIPQFGTYRIILGSGLVLMGLGLGPLVLLGLRAKKLWLAGAVVAVVGSVAVAAQPVSTVVYSKDGIYEKLLVYDGIYQGHPTRFFKQDRSNSGAMYLDSDELAYNYTRYYKLHEAFSPRLDNALVIGGGIYTIPKELLKTNNHVQVDVAEIEPSLFELAQKYFRLQPSPRLHNHVEDGRRLLAKNDQKYNLIFSDVYHSFYSVPAHFTTKEFFELAKQRLQPEGVFVANIIGDLSRQQPSLMLSEMRTFQKVFPNSYFFAVDSPLAVGPQNIMVVGYNSDTRPDLQSAQLRQHPDILLRHLYQQQIDPARFEFSGYPLLTDDYSPVEYLSGKVLTRNFGPQPVFNGNEMLATITQQLRYGPRHLGSPGHAKMQDFLMAEMKAMAGQATVQSWTHSNKDGSKQELKNIIGRFNPDKKERVVLATHYDTKSHSERDPRHSDQPVPGANDGASGVAVLLDAARRLGFARPELPVGVDIVFFDGEEGEAQVTSQDWQPLGSQYFAQNLTALYPEAKPVGGVVVDMVCGKKMQLRPEPSSLTHASSTTNQFWSIGKQVAPQVFANEPGPVIRDDHTALNAAGIPSFVVIDSAYPAFHTAADTADKCSPQSLSSVAETLDRYLSEMKL